MPVDPGKIFTADAHPFPRNSGAWQQSASLSSEVKASIDGRLIYDHQA
jgi:hypothetical protein